MRKRPLLWFACSLLLGLAYQRYQMLALCSLLIFFLGIELWIGMRCKSYKKMAGRSLCLLSAFILGMAHMEKEEVFRENYFSKVEEESQVIVWGEIKKIETTDVSIRVILSDCYIHLEEKTIPCNDVMVYASSNHFQVGEIHKITGEFHRFQVARNEGNFHSRTYYESQKIDFYLYEEESQLLGRKENILRDLLLSFKDQLLQVYENGMEVKAAGFYKAMLLGEKEDLDENLKELFSIGGISHILAISGLHVSMIGRSFYKCIRKRQMSFLTAGILAGMLLLSYSYMIGDSVSAQRAIGMMLLFFFGQWLGRSYDMLNALGGMCIFLLWQNPFVIEYSGFWFSVMALIGVGFVGKIFEDYTEKGKGFWISMGIQLATLPIVALSYFEIPLYSPVVNFLLLPLLTPMFILALAGGMIGLFSPSIAKLLFWPSSLGLDLYECVCNFVKGLPVSTIITGAPSLPQVVIYYAVLILGLMMLNGSEKKKLWKMVFFCGICFSIILYPKEHSFEISFLDVGQGDGIYISLGDGTTCFIDGGSLDVDKLGEYRLLSFLKSKGVREIDYWFVSHGDMDHISGILEVFESGYPVSYLVMADAAPRDENYMMLLDTANQAGIKVISMKEGEQILSKYGTITCLYPEEKTMRDRNEASLVLQVDIKESAGIGSFSALFAGDISEETERLLLQKGKLSDITLLKGIHHGSNYSNSQELLQCVKPELIVVSCGVDNIYGHPGTSAVERMEESGAELFYTMDWGQITIRFDELKKGLVTDGFLLLQYPYEKN